MQKIYLLLQGNQQKGPFSLEELLAFNLQPHDLIWIEGKSSGCYYPQEIEALRPHLAFLNKATFNSKAAGKYDGEEKQNHVFISFPDKPNNTSLPRVNEEVSANAEVDVTPVQATTFYKNTTFNKSKKRKYSPTGVAVAMLIVVLALAGWWLASPHVKSEATNPSTQLAVTTELPITEPAEKFKNETSANQKKQSSKKKSIALLPDNKKRNNKALEKRQEGIAGIKTATAIDNEYESPAESVIEDVQPEKVNSNPQETVKEKKKLKEKFLDLFKKKPGEKADDAANTSTDDEGRRGSARREAVTDPALMVSVNFHIPNDWMMGIKGATATLKNRSSQPVTKASIEILYYNDDMELLDKKQATFTNIDAKKSKSIIIPDHATATRLEYKIVQVTTANEPYAML